MGLLWSDQAPLLEDPAVSKVAGKIGYSLIPSNTGEPFSQLEGLTYLIPTESKHPREAYKFLELGHVRARPRSTAVARELIP